MGGKFGEIQLEIIIRYIHTRGPDPGLTQESLVQLKENCTKTGAYLFMNRNVCEDEQRKDAHYQYGCV